ncbi:MAG: carbohydrate kinase family protein [Ignavibacteriales bacterium]|nr:carbohydrate kinase family protein [Ignavibacteriales bacterium]
MTISGGIFYTALTLSLLKQETDELFLCTLIEDEHYQLFAGAFDSFDRSFCTSTPRIPRVHLTIFDEKERCERFENLNTPVVLPDVDLQDFDGIIINMISGFEMDADALSGLRQRFKGPIYFDVHSLARGVGNSLVREFRPIPQFYAWAKNLTVIQANEHEVLTLSETSNTEEQIALQILNLEPEYFIVTKGERGVSLYTKNHAELKKLDIPAIATEVRNKVGCGDVFGAYFFYHYITHKNAEEAVRLAVVASGCITRYRNFSEFSNLLADVSKFNN